MTNEDKPVYDDRSSYLDMALYRTEQIISQATATLKELDFDTLVGTGLSGTLVVPLVARAMGKHFAIVRKENDSSHACTLVEGRVGKRWIFLDDCIASGRTRRRVKDAIADMKVERWVPDTSVVQWGGRYQTDRVGDQTEFVGEYLYLDNLYHSAPDVELRAGW